MDDVLHEYDFPDAARPVPHLRQALRNIVQMLQIQPEHYRNFGIFWWPLKRILREHGYGPEHVWYLGDYQDPGAPTIKAADDWIVAQALAYYGWSVAHGPHAHEYHPLTSEPYDVIDIDASLLT